MIRFILLFVILTFYSGNILSAQCAQGSYTLNPPPVNGQYESGQTVQICLQFNYSQTSVDWVHGIVPIIPEGWDVSSINVTPPPSCSGSGTWGWYQSVTSSANGNTYGPGLFYDQYNDGNPGNNFGDNLSYCGYNLSFCMTITTADCNGDDLDGANLNLQFQILGDNFSGSWGSGGNSCPPGQNTIMPGPGQNTTLSCCSGEEAFLEICSSSPNQILFNSFSSSPAGGTWTNPSGGAFNGTFIPGTSPDGIYSYSFDDGDCAAVSTVEVTTIPEPDAGTGENITICEGADAFNLGDQIIGGDAGGTWTGPGNIPVSDVFTPGVSAPGLYTYTVGDGIDCPTSQTVVNISVEPNPFAGDDGSLTVCESDPQINLFNFLMNGPESGGTWTDPSGGSHDGLLSPSTDEPGNYTYSIGDPPCSSSATVSVTIVELPYAGQDISISLCPDDAPVDLFNVIPGANAGGFWADPDNAGFSGIFSPGSDQPGDYVYQIGGAACNDVAVVTVVIPDLPTGFISADATYCEGSNFPITFNLTGNGPFDIEYGINGNDYTLNGISDGHSEMVSSTGDAEIELISITGSDPGACPNSGNTIEVEMIPTPSAQIVGGGGICEGADGTLTFELTGSGPFDIVYTDGSQNFSLNGISNGHVETVNPTENPTYTLISVADNSLSSCDGNVSGSASFAVNEAPAGSISGSANICIGESTELTFELEGTGPFDVVYTDGANNFSLTGINDGHTISVSPQFLSFYELVSVTSQGNPNCPGITSGNVIITVSVPPVYYNLNVTCNNVNEAYTVSFHINGGDPGSYQVEGDSGEITGNVFTSDEIPSGSSYTFLLDDGNGCGPVEISGDHTCDCTTSAGTMQVEDLVVCSSELAIATHNNDEILDPNDILVFLLTDSPYYSTSTIFIENDEPEFEFQDDLLELNTTYYITGVASNDAGGTYEIGDPCWSVTSQATVTFIESPTAGISGSGAICPGEVASLDIALNGSAPWTVEYAVDGISTGNFISNNNNYTLDVDQGGSYTLLNVTDALCAGTTSGEVVVTEFEVPTATISGGGNICAGSGDGPEVTLTGSAPWTITYTVDGQNPETIIINNSPHTIEATTSGNYVITGVSDNNCTGEGLGTAAVTIVEPPTAGVSGGGQICDGDTGEITFNGTGNGDVQIMYAINGVTEGTVNLINGSATLQTSEPGTYSIVQVEDDFCSGSGNGTTAELIVNPIPTADINLNPSTLCEGDSALLSITFTGNGPFGVVYSIGGEMIIADNTSNIHQYVFPENGQEFALISVSDNSNPSCGQNLVESVTAQVLITPEAPVLTDIFRCNNDTFPQIGVEPLPNLNYSWSPQAGLSNPNISNPVLNLENNTDQEQTYTFILTAHNGICGVQSSMEVTINPGPQVDFSYNPKPVSTEATTVNFLNHTPGINDYEWLVNEISVSTNTNIHYTFPDGIEGNYNVTLIATDTETGCTNQHAQLVEVKGELMVYVPNAFTPDGDGINELFGPVVRNHLEGQYDFSIFNRQGELVFNSSSPDLKWDGSESGQDYFAKDGVYIWLLKIGDIYSSEIREYQGTVTIVR